jgi:hypothetical protein
MSPTCDQVMATRWYFDQSLMPSWSQNWNGSTPSSSWVPRRSQADGLSQSAYGRKS